MSLISKGMSLLDNKSIKFFSVSEVEKQSTDYSLDGFRNKFIFITFSISSRDFRKGLFCDYYFLTLFFIGYCNNCFVFLVVTVTNYSH